MWTTRDSASRPRRVVLTEVTSRAEADLIVGLLAANDVPAISSADDIGGAYPGIGRVRVLVAESDLERAANLLEQSAG